MIYLDNSAGTRPYWQVVATITDALTNHWGNASAEYSFGKDAMTIIDTATQHVAEDINCDLCEIVWTSGACEANSLAILGFFRANSCYNVYTTCLDHSSVDMIIPDLPFNIKRLKIPVDSDGRINPEQLRQFIIDTSGASMNKPFVSISAASSEIGTIQDIQAIAKVVHERKGILHVDATQLYPWTKIDVNSLGIDMMSVSGQKMHCVKGVGFLYVRDGIQLKPLVYGTQQDGRRGGTYPTHLIAAFDEALRITRNNNKTEYVQALRDHMLDKLLTLPGVRLNGPENKTNRLVNNISLTIDGVSAEALVTMCDMFEISIARGSACKSYEQTPSKALLGIGLTPEQALSTVRITLDEFNTEDEIDRAAEIIAKLVGRIRNS